MCRIGYHCYGVYLQACMGFIWSDCLDCVPVFLLISFWFLFVLWLVFGVCVLSCYGYGGEWGKTEEEKRLLLLLFFFTLPCVGIVCGEEWGRGGFLCVGHVRCASAGLCVGHCVLLSCLWGVLWPSRAFSCLDRVFICLSRESALKWIYRPFLFFYVFFIGFAYLPHILSLCLGWGRCMFYIRTHAERDTHIEDVRFVRGGV